MVVKIWEKLVWILWVLLVIALPLTSVPIVAKLTGSESVAPGSLFFLIPLAILFFPLFIYRKQRAAFHTKPALVFFLFAFFSIILAVFRVIPDYKDHAILMSALEGTVTLTLGLLFYFVSVCLPDSRTKIDKTLRILNWVGLILIAWSILSIVVKQFIPTLRPVINEIQSLFSVTRSLKTRMTGFASEPSWLAHMLNLVFLAYWLAATVGRTSVHKFRIWRFSFENFLLLGGVVVLIGTFSRGGLAAFMLVVAFLFVLINIKFIKWVTKKWKSQHHGWLTVFISIAVIAAYFGLLLGGLFALSKIDPRMADVFTFSSGSSNPLIKYADNLQFGERVVYWQTGWNIFNAHPITGVGIGFSGYYFPDYLPDSGWGLTEAKNLLFRSEGLLNIKSIWSRLLAETGIIGFSLFLTLLLISTFTSIEMVKSKFKMRRSMGFMGLFMIIALSIEGFSVDSFALPYLWFTLGLTAAAWRWYFPDFGEVNG